jgi:hypothetical protein
MKRTNKKPAKFRTPHERKAIAKSAKAEKSSAPQPTGKKDEVKATGRDAFGGRIGSRMSKINLVVIKAGTTGATVAEVAEKTRETASIVSAQLGWIVTHKKFATRKEEAGEGGKKTFRYFVKNSE